MSESDGSLGGSRRSTAVVEERRARAYSMYLKGFSEVQIAEELHVNQSTVSRALEAKWRENVGLFEKEGEKLLRSFFQEERDRYSDLLHEEWSHYYSIPSDNVSGRSQALSAIRATLGSMGQMAGRLIAELDEAGNRRRLDELEAYVKESKQRDERPAGSPAGQPAK